MNLSTDEIYSLFGACPTEKTENQVIEGVSTDSRSLTADQVFFAIRGENFDGNDYIEKALSQGACLVVGERTFPDRRVITVTDSVLALGILAKYYRRKFDIPVIAITGSVGKTSTKEMIKSVLMRKFNVHSTTGNLNNHIGMPMTLFHLSEEHDISVLEMGMSHFNEIDYLSDIASPTFAVFTNIGVSHIGNLGSRENILKAKLEMLSHMKPYSTVLINGDDDMLKTLKDRNDFSVISFGFNQDNDYAVSQFVNESEERCSFSLNGHSYILKTGGRHNVYNALPAIIIGEMNRISKDQIQEGLYSYQNAKMRMDIIKKGTLTIINDAYNANTQSMKAAIEVLSLYPNRKVAILGEMLELGDFSDISHEEIGAFTATQGIDVLIAVGHQADKYRIGAVNKNMKSKMVYTFNDFIELKTMINDIIMDNDVILLKGSRGSKMEETLNLIDLKE